MQGKQPATAAMSDPRPGPSFAGSPPASRGLRPGLLSTAASPLQLTEAIRSCQSLHQLACLWQGHDAIQRQGHVAAYLKQVVKLVAAAVPTSTCPDLNWLDPAVSAQLQQLLQQLLSHLNLHNCTDFSPKSIARIMWALAEVRCTPDVCSCRLLLDRFCEQPVAAPHEISSILWGVAKLTKEGATSASTARSDEQQAADAADLQSQKHVCGPGSSTSAVQPSSADSACGSGARPLLSYDQVHLLLQRLCQAQQCASVQMISNSLWCVGVLQQYHGWCVCSSSEELQALATAFCDQLQEAPASCVQTLTRCLSQFATSCMSHAEDTWLRWQVPLLRQLLDYIGTQHSNLQPQHVISILCDVAQIACLDLLLQKQPPHAAEVAGVQAPLHVPATSLHASSTLIIQGAPSSACSPAGAGASSSAAHHDLRVDLMQLATSGGPWDVSSAVMALAMLQPHLRHLGLQSGVAALCQRLSSERSLCVDPRLWRELLAITMQEEAPQPATNATFECGVASALLKHRDVVAQVFSQTRRCTPAVETPPASHGSFDIWSSSTDDNSVAHQADEDDVSPAPYATSDTIHTRPQPCVDSSINAIKAAAVSAGAHTHPGGTSQQLRGQEADTTAVSSTSKSPGSTATQLGTVLGGSAARAAPGHADTLTAPTVVPAAPPCLSEGTSSGGEQDSEDVAARQLTHNIAYADSVFQLASIFSLHSNIMDMIHITACITRLSKVLGTTPSEATQAAAAKLLPELDAKLLSVLPSANARGIANVLWGYGRLRALPQLQLLPALVGAFLQQMPNAACRDSAVVLWSLSRLMEGHGEGPQAAIPQVLLCRLGRAALQQMATAARRASGNISPQDQIRPPPPRQQTQQQGVFPGAQAAHPQLLESVDGQPSARDISNSLMALARLGFIPDTAHTEACDPHNPPHASMEPQNAAATAAAEATVQAQQGSAAATVQSQSVASAGSGGGSSPHVTVPASANEPGITSPLTLPVSQVTDVVEYLLGKVATAKTLDLQETATALKQFGLRDLHMEMMAAVMHHGAPQTSSPAPRIGSLQGSQGPSAARSYRAGGGPGAPLGAAHRGPAGPVRLSSTPRRPPGRTPAPPYASVSGVPGQQQAVLPGWQLHAPGLLRQGSQLGYGSPNSRAAQTVPTDVIPTVQPHQHQLYTLSAACRPPGLAVLGTSGSGVAPYGVMPGAEVVGASDEAYDAHLSGRPSHPPGGCNMQYVGSQQQQAAGMRQGQAGRSYAPLMQYVMMQQQEPPHQPVGGYVVQSSPPSQPSPQQEQLLVMGMPAFQHQGPTPPPPVILGAATDGRVVAQPYFMQGSSAGPPGLPPLSTLAQQGASQSAGQQQQLLHPVQQAYSAVGPNMTGLNRLGRVAANSSSSAMLMETRANVERSIYGDAATAVQQQAAPAQLQFLQRESPHAGALYGQPQALLPGYQRQDMSTTFLQPSQQVASLYGVGGSSPPPTQQHLAASLGSAVGTLVLDPSTGLYHLQQ